MRREGWRGAHSAFIEVAVPRVVGSGPVSPFENRLLQGLRGCLCCQCGRRGGGSANSATNLAGRGQGPLSPPARTGTAAS